MSVSIIVQGEHVDVGSPQGGEGGAAWIRSMTSLMRAVAAPRER
jgi:hypothetical protein